MGCGWGLDAPYHFVKHTGSVIIIVLSQEFRSDDVIDERLWTRCLSQNCIDDGNAKSLVTYDVQIIIRVALGRCQISQKRLLFAC